MTDLMSERYGGGKHSHHTLLVVLVGVLAGVSLGWLVWAAWFHSTPGVQAGITSYDVVSAHAVDVRLDLRVSDTKVPATCLLRATARDHSVVGEKNVRADQMVARGVDRVRLRTERRATTVEVVRCQSR